MSCHVTEAATKLAIMLEVQDDLLGHDNAPADAQKIDDALQKAMECLNALNSALCQTEDLTEDVEEILRNNESKISELEQIYTEADSLKDVDFWMLKLQRALFNHDFSSIFSQFPGVHYYLGYHDYFMLDPSYFFIPFWEFSHVVEMFHDTRNTQFIPPGATLKAMCSPAATLRNILKGQRDADAYKELLKNLRNFPFLSGHMRNVMQQQLWRIQDLRDGGGLGFTVELFFLALDQLLSTSSSKESHSALYIGTFRTITSDWSKLKHSLGTQNLLLYIAWSRFSKFEYHYPAYITEEFLELLRNSFEGQTRSRIDEVVQQLESVHIIRGFRNWDRALEVIGARTQ